MWGLPKIGGFCSKIIYNPPLDNGGFGLYSYLSTREDGVLTGGDVMELTERKKKVLQTVVDLYIRTAEPVGSKAIAAMPGMN